MVVYCENGGLTVNKMGLTVKSGVSTMKSFGVAVKMVIVKMVV